MKRGLLTVVAAAALALGASEANARWAFAYMGDFNLTEQGQSIVAIWWGNAHDLSCPYGGQCLSLAGGQANWKGWDTCFGFHPTGTNPIYCPDQYEPDCENVGLGSHFGYWDISSSEFPYKQWPFFKADCEVDDFN